MKNLISRFVVTIVLGLVSSVVGCAYSAERVHDSFKIPQPTVATKKACFTKPPYYSHAVGKFTCDKAKIALVANMFQEAQDFGACDPESGDAFWRFLGALKIFRACENQISFPRQLRQKILLVKDAFSSDLGSNIATGRDCSQELQAFQETMQAPQSP